MIRPTWCAALALAALLTPVPTAAQGSVTIFGSVTDSSGAVVPGATITVTNAQTAFESALSAE